MEAYSTSGGGGAVKDGYTSKTISYGQVTIRVYRPILDDGEREKRKQQIVDGLEHGLRDYLKRM